jgi:hypothetical protein
MSGLSPDALCRIFQFDLICINVEIKSFFWRNQKISKLLLVARSALNLYECAVSTSNADLTLWIFKEQPIIEINQLTQNALNEGALH